MGIEKTQAPISYLTKDLTGQRATQNGFKHAYSDNLRLKSLETCLAYSNIVTDLSIIIQPQGEENRWEKRVERFDSYTNTYWKPFSVFDKTVLTESDARVRQFLNLDYSDSRKEDNISLKIDDLEDQAYFILRTHNEKIGEISGGSYTEIEDHAYLITAWQEEVTITLKNDSSLTYEYQ
jgi:hypothetical protein